MQIIQDQDSRFTTDTDSLLHVDDC